MSGSVFCFSFFEVAIRNSSLIASFHSALLPQGRRGTLPGIRVMFPPLPWGRGVYEADGEGVLVSISNASTRVWRTDWPTKGASA